MEKEKDEKEFEKGMEEYIDGLGEDVEHAGKKLQIEELAYKLKIGNLDQLVKDKLYVDSISEATLEQKDKIISAFKNMLAKRIEKESAENEDGGIEGEVADAEYKVVVDENEKIKFLLIELENGEVRCINNKNKNEYILNLEKPTCTCEDFQINKEKSEYCKHLTAAIKGGYEVAELIPIAKEVKDLVPRNGKGNRVKARTPDIVTISILEQKIDIPAQTPKELILNEECAVKMITDILGKNPKRTDVIESYQQGKIQELSADVIISMAQYAGIPFMPLKHDIEEKEINLGRVYAAIATDNKYDKLTEFMPDTTVVTRCKITCVAGWRDGKGNLRIGVGTKEEYLTPPRLRDIASRGANFIETTCESKAYKKAILNALPITHDGLLAKIKVHYKWE